MAVSRETLHLLRDLRAATGSQADDAVRTITDAWVQAWERLLERWQRVIDQLIADARRRGYWPAPLDIGRVDAPVGALAATDAELATLGTLVVATVAGGAAMVITAVAAAEPLIIASQVPAKLAAQFAASVGQRILPTALDVIRVRAAQAITAQSRPLGRDAAQALRRELIRGVRI